MRTAINNLIRLISESEVSVDNNSLINFFDVLIDNKGEPWLLEVNHAPSFNCDTALDARVKKNLLRDTFRILNLSY